MEKNKKKKEYKSRLDYKESDFSHEKYGEKLALSVAKKLQEKKEFVLGRHRDFCGNCIYYDGKYHFTYCNDGYPDKTDIIAFDDEDSFVKWLSEKNDFKMSGFDPSDELYEKDDFLRNNQRISKIDLEKFIKQK